MTDARMGVAGEAEAVAERNCPSPALLGAGPISGDAVKPDDDRHGSYAGYRAGCKRDCCLTAAREYMSERRAMNANAYELEQVDTADCARFWMKVRVSPADACWEWLASLDRHGYGNFGFGYRSVRAHRVAYQLSGQDLDPELHLDHLCRNRACVNPAHLEQVTQAENTRRGAAAKTHCPHGHPYDEENTYYRANGRRVCRACNRASSNRYYRERVRA